MKKITRLVGTAIRASENAARLIERHYGAIAGLSLLRSEVEELHEKFAAAGYVPTDADQNRLRTLEYEIQSGDWRQR